MLKACNQAARGEREKTRKESVEGILAGAREYVSKRRQLAVKSPREVSITQMTGKNI